MFINSARLAGFFGVTPKAVNEWVNKRQLPCRRTIGGHMRFDPEKVRAYLEERNIVVPEPLLRLTEGPKRTSPALVSATRGAFAAEEEK